MEDNQTVKEEFQKLNFFQKVWYSITKFEKYPEMAALGVKKAILYFTKLMLIFSIIYTGIYVYYVENVVNFEDDNLTLSEKVATILLERNENIEENEEFQEVIYEFRENSYVTTVIGLFIGIFIAFFISTLLDAVTLSIFGVITSFIAKIRMNYKAIFNMSIFALTLSIILRIIYLGLTMLTDFKVKYFDVMYIAVAYISLAAAIFMIKSNVIKQHLELMRIIEESKDKIEETMENLKNPKDEEDDEEEKDNKEEQKKEDKPIQGQGSNA